MQLPGGLFSLETQFARKLHFPTSFAVRVKDGPARHGSFEHLFQTERLGTELNVVVHPFSTLAQFEFDWKAGSVGTLFHDVALAVQSNPLRPHGQSAEQINSLHDFVPREIGVLVDKFTP